MEPKQIEKLGIICITLQEFCYALDTLDSISDDCEPGCAKIRFYMNSLYSYVANFFLLDNGSNIPIAGNLYPALKELGLEENLNQVVEILKEKIESLELQEVIRKFRNKVIVHTDYSFNALDDHTYNKVDLRTKDNFLKYQELLQNLYYNIKELYIHLKMILLYYDKNYFS